MFFLFSKIEQEAHYTEGLENPRNSSNPMVFGIYRTRSRTAFFTVYSKKAFGEFWDDTARKKIPTRLWTAEMKTFAKQKITTAPQPPFIFKFTFIGWIFVFLIFGLFGYIIYDSVKPSLPESAEYVAMKQAPAEGDIYFGHYEAYKEAGSRISTSIGFGWFKVVSVKGNIFYISRSTQMNKGYKPKEELNSITFEAESIPVTITEQQSYMINLKSADGKTELYFTDKK